MNDASMESTLFVHTRRPQWGLALLTRNGRERRAFLFQDGRKRTFKRGFFHLLEPADKPLDVLTRVRQTLQNKLGKTAQQRTVLTRDAAEQVVRLETQAKVFKHLFPGGFQGERYTLRHRDDGKTRRLKRHLDRAVAQAQRELAQPVLAELLAQGQHAEIHRRACDVVAGTGLVAAPERKGLCSVPEDRKPEFAEALYGLLHGEGEHFDRFTRWMAALTHRKAKRVKWPVATVLPALMHPQTEVCVNARPFAKEANWLAPQLVVGKQPDAAVYARLRKMTVGLREQLEARDLAPRDLLDVRTFVVLAFKPKHLAMITGG